MAQGAAASQGTLLIAILLNVCLFGLVSEQFYAYWIIGFKDPIRLRLFVVAQFVAVAFQSLIMWHLALDVFVQVQVVTPSPRTSGPAPPPPPGPPPPSAPWEGPINSLCQLVIILMANIFLAYRIYGLTKSRVRSAVVIVLSTIAFLLGMVTNVMTWRTPFIPAVHKGTSVAWHAIQAVAEFLITFFLSRELWKSRSGLRQSDSAINHIVRRSIQTGCLASAWALIALATWFLLPRVAVYRIFDVTSGTVYTHAVFETLLSRIRLRERLLLRRPTYLELGLQLSQDEGTGSYTTSGRLRGSVSVPRGFNRWLRPFHISGFEHGSNPTSKNDIIELESRVVG